MTLVTIDLGDVAGGHHPDDHVIIRAENFRESPGGGVTSTAEVKIPLVDGAGQAEVEPGPVVVTFRCQAVADTREKRGVVPESGTVGIEEVIGRAFEYSPPVVNHGLDLIEDARDEALGQVEGAVDEAIGTRLDAKADASTVSDLSALTAGVTGVARRNSSRIRELVSELDTKVDQAGVDAALEGKADTGTVDELSALVVSALGVGRRNADRIRQLAAGEIGQSDLAEALATKADTHTLEARVPTGGIPGQLLMATPTGGRWSWAGRFPSGYHDKY